MEPRYVGLIDFGDLAFGDEFIAGRGKDMRVDPLISRACVGDLLLQGTCKGNSMGGKNSQEAFPG